jgi:hypothetical protein
MMSSQNTRKTFKAIHGKILNAYKTKILPNPPPDGGKSELTDKEWEDLSLKESDIRYMEYRIEAYKSEIHLKFDTFQAVL